MTPKQRRFVEEYPIDRSPTHAARADTLRRAGRKTAAAKAYRQALALTRNAAERRFLEGRLGDMLG